MRLKRFLLLPLIYASILAYGCTKEGHEGQAHSGHEDVEVSGDGRIVKFNRDSPVIDLVSQDGKRVTNDDLRGKIVLVNFTYTNCDESCPVMMHKFIDIADKMGDRLGKDLLLVTITMDPEKDTVDVLKNYAVRMDIDTSKWMFLTGDRESVDSVLKSFGFFYAKNDDGSFGHANTIVMLDRTGRWRYSFSILTQPADVVINRLREEI